MIIAAIDKKTAFYVNQYTHTWECDWKVHTNSAQCYYSWATLFVWKLHDPYETLSNILSEYMIWIF